MGKSSKYVVAALLSMGVTGHAFSDSTKNTERRITELQWFKDKRMELALDLYKNMAGVNQQENFAMSPYSISKSLSMLLAGTKSSTQLEIFEALGIGQTLSESMVHDNAAKIMMELENRNQRAYSLEAASAIWTEDQLELNGDFQTTLAQNYWAPARGLDFSLAPEGSRQQINQWTSDNTDGHIKELLPEGSIDQDTKMVVTDALYYKGAWLFPFNDKTLTSDLFYKADGSQNITNFMNIRAEYPYYEEGSVRAVALPIIAIDQQSSFEQVMIFVQTTDENMPLSELEPKLSANVLKDIWQKHRKKHVDLSLPKFKFRSEKPLKPILSAMGMKLAFDPYRADFSRVFENSVEGLHLKDIYHQAYIDVNETGIEAAAATAAVAGCTSAPIEVVQMKLNRPFMFYVYDIPSQSIVFMGRLQNP